MAKGSNNEMRLGRGESWRGEAKSGRTWVGRRLSVRVGDWDATLPKEIEERREEGRGGGVEVGDGI